MFKAYKYRIYPNREQEEKIDITFKACRFVYNYYLQKQIDLYKNGEKRLSAFDCMKDVTELKKDELWLNGVSSQSLFYAIGDLDIAYKKFFKEHTGFPKFKSEEVHRQSYCTKGSIHYKGNYIKIPKLGFVRTRNKLVPEGRFLSITISKEPSGKYFVSLCCDDVAIVPLLATGKVAGLALDIENICVTSDGKFYKNQNNLQQSLDKLAKLQRELSRKEKGSANYEKARIKVAKLHEHITNQRKDYLQKVTTDLIRNYDVLYMEDPEIKQVIQESDLALKIADASLYKFIFMLKYKAEYYGKRIIFVNKDVLLDANTYDVEYLRGKAEEILYAGLDQQQDELLAA